MKTIVFDFDNVIHTGYDGYKDGSIYGKIDLELIEYIKLLMKNYCVVISTCRPANQIVDYMNNLDLGVKFELFKRDFDKNLYWKKENVIGVSNEKVPGIMYIDDKGYKYNNLENLRKEIGE